MLDDSVSECTTETKEVEDVKPSMWTLNYLPWISKVVLLISAVSILCVWFPNRTWWRRESGTPGKLASENTAPGNTATGNTASGNTISTGHPPVIGANEGEGHSELTRLKENLLHASGDLRLSCASNIGPIM